MLELKLIVNCALATEDRTETANAVKANDPPFRTDNDVIITKPSPDNLKTLTTQCTVCDKPDQRSLYTEEPPIQSVIVVTLTARDHYSTGYKRNATLFVNGQLIFLRQGPSEECYGIMAIAVTDPS